MLNAGFQNKSKNLLSHSEHASFKIVNEMPVANHIDLTNRRFQTVP
jgi:hypothetical protein